VPNWIANIVYVTGSADAARALRALMTTPRSKFDFHAILPMPDDLAKSEASTRAETAWQLKYGDWTEINHDYGPGQFASRDDALAAARAVDAWRPLAVIRHGETLPVIKPRSFDDLADTVQSFVVKYGFPDWYEWACATWGTKWPAVAAGWMGPTRLAKRDAEQVAYFDTANGPPIEVILELSRRFPDVIVRLEFYECAGGLCGFVTAQDGCVIAEKRSEWDAYAESIIVSHDLRHEDGEFPIVYIGHARCADDHGPSFPRSPWANPFVRCDCSPEEALDRYRRWLHGDARVVEQLPPGEWPLPDVDGIRATFFGKTILCDCGSERDERRCPAEVLSDLAFNRDGEVESLADDECDDCVQRACDATLDATDVIVRLPRGD
jgi:hypothetical protein